MSKGREVRGYGTCSRFEESFSMLMNMRESIDEGFRSVMRCRVYMKLEIVRFVVM